MGLHSALEIINKSIDPAVKLTTIGSGAVLVKMNLDSLKDKKNSGKTNSPNITALPGSTVVINHEGAHKMKKIAGDEQCCMNAAFASELAKIQGQAGVGLGNEGAADLEQRKAELNGKHGVLGTAGMSQATARSVAVNQGPVTEQAKV